MASPNLPEPPWIRQAHCNTLESILPAAESIVTPGSLRTSLSTLEVSVRVRLVPGVRVDVDANGGLEVLAGAPGLPGRYFCGPVGTTMWIVLHQHDGDIDAAARMLAALWETEPANARADLDIWVDELRDAGLVQNEP